MKSGHDNAAEEMFWPHFTMRFGHLISNFDGMPSNPLARSCNIFIEDNVTQ